jgi:predicted  nucleic acid-binding Zn-ribbon protein
MPHQCTNCSRVFADGSKEMLSGCPDCGGNKFQFRPDGADEAETEPAPSASPPDPPESPTGGGVARTVGKTAATVRDLVSSDETEPSIGADPASQPATSTEDTAQADARTDVVSPGELPTSASSDTEHRFEPAHQSAGPVEQSAPGEGPESDSEVSDEAARADRPDLTELREELNDQFESIKVLSPGQYELNLMELYDRDEYIIALQEDGRYSIQMPDHL